MLELLAPAGSMEALRGAVQNGANAVYLGCGSYNARQGAENFTLQTLTEAVKYCHVRGVAVHLTLNTLVSDREMPGAAELIAKAAGAGVDAFILQDWGVAQLCRQIAPGVARHASTQMTIHSLSGVQMCAAWGFSRVVLSRELNREEIANICRNSPIEIEVFVHGALCMCYSGQCYLSAAIGGRSGNRGRCAQPCRQSYGYGRYDERRHPLSLKDNCLVDYLGELEKMGVASVKIEGRMKRPEYVAAVTGVYRQAMDSGQVTPEMRQRLTRAFNRQGFTDGYYTGRRGGAMFGIREDPRGDPSYLASVRQSYETVEHPLVDVTMAAQITAQGSRITVTDPEGRSCTVKGAVPEEAKTQPLTQEALTQRLSKTGGTPYRCAGVEITLEPGLMLSSAQINAMRREALNRLTAIRGRRESGATGRAEKVVRFSGRKALPGLTIQVTTREQLTEAVLRAGAEMLYVPAHILGADLEFTRNLAFRHPVAAVLPRIVRDGEMETLTALLKTLREAGVRDALVGNAGLILPVRGLRMAIHGDFGLNLYNSRSVNLAREMEFASVGLSYEMTLPQIRDVSKGVPCEILAYGRMALMVTDNCLIRGRTGKCTCQLGPVKLMDKTGAEFPIIRDGDSCRSVLLNGKKLSMLDRQEDLARLGLWAARLYFTTENPREVSQVLESWRAPAPFDPGACTRGLYLRGVE